MPMNDSTAPELTQLTAELTRQQRLTHRLKARWLQSAPPGLDWGASSLLHLILDTGSLRQSELASRACLDPSTVSRHVSALVQAGLA
jgi:DNA-binding MarR family transcriptional regulator